MSLWDTSDWRKIQRNSFSNLESLARFLNLSEEQKGQLCFKRPFPFLLPYRLAEKIEKGTLDDPILRQFIPFHAEQSSPPRFIQDPVEDKAFQKTTRLLKKYQSRALILTSGACAMHCRYCFRQNYPYDRGERVFNQELEEIKKDPSLIEVILSGGDPLSLSDHILCNLLSNLDAIPHLHLIRFHSRFLVGIPERVTPQLLQALENSSKSIWFVLHINHPKEIDSDVKKACEALKKAGVSLLNQAVLLHGINANLATQVDLSKALVSAGIFPYYLHQLDPVEGAAHFETEASLGLEIIEKMRTILPGYAVPQFVQEIPGAQHKTLVASP